MKSRLQNTFPALKKMTLVAGVYFLISYVFAWQQGLIGKESLPKHLREELHRDYKFLKIVPRWATSGKFVEPPLWLAGNQEEFSYTLDIVVPQPLPGSNQWQFSLVQIRERYPFYLPYLALTIQNVHFRAGCRWDDTEHYYTFPSLALKIHE